jgi:hypothetical protein
MRFLLAASAYMAIAASFSSASAENIYAYCRSSNNDCSYSTYEQCRAAISGAAGDCIANPAYTKDAVVAKPAPAKSDRKPRDKQQ